MMMKQSNRANYTSRSFLVDQTTPLTVPSNMHRDYFLVFNKSSSSIQIRFGESATANEDIDIPPNGYFEPLMTPTNSFTITSIVPSRVVLLMTDQEGL